MFVISRSQSQNLNIWYKFHCSFSLYENIMPLHIFNVTGRRPVCAFTSRHRGSLNKCTWWWINPIINCMTTAVCLYHPDPFCPVGLWVSVKHCSQDAQVLAFKSTFHTLQITGFSKEKHIISIQTCMCNEYITVFAKKSTFTSFWHSMCTITSLNKTSLLLSPVLHTCNKEVISSLDGCDLSLCKIAYACWLTGLGLNTIFGRI